MSTLHCLSENIYEIRRDDSASCYGSSSSCPFERTCYKTAICAGISPCLPCIITMAVPCCLNLWPFTRYDCSYYKISHITICGNRYIIWWFSSDMELSYLSSLDKLCRVYCIPTLHRNYLRRCCHFCNSTLPRTTKAHGPDTRWRTESISECCIVTNWITSCPIFIHANIYGIRHFSIGAFCHSTKLESYSTRRIVDWSYNPYSLAVLVKEYDWAVTVLSRFRVVVITINAWVK